MALLSTNPLSGLLRGSPFKPLQQHMRIVFSCVCQIPPLFEALYSKDNVNLAIYAEEIIKLESEADKIKNSYRISMPKTLFLAVDRKDLLGLMSDQEKMAGAIEEIAKLILYRDMIVPDELKELLDELLEATMQNASEALAIIEQLDELLEVGFGGRASAKVNKMIEGVRHSERSIDEILHRTRRALFEAEHKLDPVSVMFWYQIIGLLGSISNLSERIADRLLLFMSK